MKPHPPPTSPVRDVAVKKEVPAPGKVNAPSTAHESGGCCGNGGGGDGDGGGGEGGSEGGEGGRGVDDEQPPVVLTVPVKSPKSVALPVEAMVT